MTGSEGASPLYSGGSLPADPHAISVEGLFRELSVSVVGLSDEEARERALVFGANIIAVHAKTSIFRIALHQFQSPVVYLLVAAAVMAGSLNQWKEAAAVLVVLAISALIGFVTEVRALRSIESLRDLGTHTARVRRSGDVRLVPAENLVPGDILLVEAGDRLSADVRLIEASNLTADEAALTGESLPTDKDVEPVDRDAPIGDRHSMLYKGTVIAGGSGAGIVVGTGLSTELGRISQLIATAETGRSPLEKRLARLSGQLIWVTLAVAVLVAAAGIFSGKEPMLMIEAAIALAVAAIPEGLPIVATLVLARGMRHMARENALVERLSAVETLGATTVILTDKTGTLTENRMAVRVILTPDTGLRILESASGKAVPEEPGSDAVSGLLRAAVLCNDATLGEIQSEDSGDPMELALLRAGAAAGLVQPALAGEYPVLRKMPFDTEVRMMATLHGSGNGAFWAVKGAPEAVLQASSRVVSGNGSLSMDGKLRADWHDKVEQLGRRGLRVLAFATRPTDRPDGEPFRDLVFLGIAGLEDPVRPDVPEAIAACQEAGIRVVMVTGDHLVTARSIGEAVGLYEHGTAIAEGADGVRLDDGDDSGFRQVGIFARVSPAEKLALVRAYQEAGEIVAMTGDGVNDAPALRQADIGVAMGRRGTDVAREAAAMILLDDAFPTIVRAIREGRIIFDNIRRFVVYLLSCNLSEVLIVGLAVLATLPLPLLPLQILYLNLITDVFPAFALAMCKGDRAVLKRPPRRPDEPILGRAQWTSIIVHSVLMTSGVFMALLLAHLTLDLDRDATVTVTFLTLGFVQLWHVFNMAGKSAGVLNNEVTRNPWVWGAILLCSVLLIGPALTPPLANVLGLTSPTAVMWCLIAAVSLLPVLVGQIGLRLFGALRRKGAR
ncbi:cation-translocating P-type ATPase [Martelella soudanensis]|uniref:cation-translocating P-type ATPase n=1 Tax=unclassified Martelella TaxID=2629616 RepID=UPI0015DE9579|nr:MULTISPECIES: HAD-IC family P-type ATPase [unclassified Martelella]